MTSGAFPGGLPSLMVLSTLLMACSTSDNFGESDEDGGGQDGSAVVDGGSTGSQTRCNVSCDEDETLTSACDCEAAGPRMRLSELGDMEGFYDMPWPHALRVKDDGSLDVDNFDFPDSVELLANNLPRLAANTFGFGTSAPIYLAFDAPLDMGTTPRDAEASLSGSASVALVNVDGDSADFGERVPVRLRFLDTATAYNDADVLAAMPEPGFTLRPDTLYALYMTEEVRGTDGNRLSPNPVFAALWEAGGEVSDELAQAYAPLVAFVEQSAIPEGSVVAGTVFRTQDPLSQMSAIADHVAALDAPSLKDIALLNLSANNPAEEGNFTLLRGFYDSPVYQQGEPPYATEGGDIGFDADGSPILQEMEEFQFGLTIPEGVQMPPDGWPVALYHHGSGGDALSFLRDGTAYHVAAAGVAMIGIDAPLHGLRNPTTDDPTLLFFNIDNLSALRDNLRQGAIDLLMLLRFVKSMEVDAADSPTGATIRFDPDNIYAMGHSQGGVTLPLMLPLQDDIKGVVLSGAGGSMTAQIVYKQKPFPIPPVARSILMLDADEVLDQLHPVLGLLQTFAESADPLNYAPYYFRWAGGSSFDLWMTSGLLDEWVPPPVTNAVATAAGVSPVAPLAESIEGLELRGLAPLDLPISANRLAADGERYTAAISQFADSDHFLIQNDPAVEAQLTHWFRTLAEDGRAELATGN